MNKRVKEIQRIWKWISLIFYSIEIKTNSLNIYASNTLILSLAKEKKNQSINIKIITDKEK